jgi:hypothetical protein
MAFSHFLHQWRASKSIAGLGQSGRSTHPTWLATGPTGSASNRLPGPDPLIRWSACGRCGEPLPRGVRAAEMVRSVAALGPPHTPDGRYFVVIGTAGPRLWRATNPNLDPDARALLVTMLMAARRAVRDARGDAEKIRTARAAVHAAKVALGERGPVWWTDGAPDLNRRLVAGSPYAEWWAQLSSK